MYANEQYGLGIIENVSAHQLDLSSTSSANEYAIMLPVKVRSLRAMVQTVMNGAATLSFYARPTLGSASSQVLIGTVIIPDLTAVTKVLYKDVAPVNLMPGQSLYVVVSSAATSGKAIAGADLYQHPEDPRNVSNMIASA